MSYSHAADGTFAPLLQASLHKFARPFYRMRAVKVFRDKTSLSANPALWPSIESALSKSAYFILLASPEAARSPWVAKELAWWLKQRSVETLLIVLTSGDICWNENASDFDWPRTTALPQLPPKQFADVPLFVDVRWSKNGEVLSLRHTQFRAAVLDVAAVLHGRPKDELDGEDVRQHRITKAAIWTALTVILAFAILAGAQWRIATRERDEALRQRNLAISRELAVSSNVQVSTDPELAILLALEAVRVAHTSEADNSLRRSLLELKMSTAIRTHAAEIVDTRFSPDGRVLLTRDSNHVLQLHDITTGQHITSVEGVVSAVFKPRSDVVVLAKQNGSVESYVVRTGARSSELTLAGERVTDVSFSRSGQRAVTIHSDGTARVRNGSTGTVTATISSGEHRIRSAEFNPDEQVLVTKSYDDTHAHIRNANNGTTLRSLEGGGDLATVSFSPNGRQLVTLTQSGYGGTAAFAWRTDTGKRIFNMNAHEKAIESAVFSPDNHYLVTASSDRLNVWEAESGRPLKSIASEFGAGPTRVIFSSDSKLMATFGRFPDCAVWSTSTWQQRAILRGHTAEITTASFSPEGTVIATGSADRTVRLWDTSTGTEVRGVSLNTIASPVSAVSSSGGLIAIGRSETVEIIHVGTLRRQEVLKGGVQRISHLAFSPSDNLLVSASSDGAGRVWNTANWTSQVTLRGHGEPVLAMAFSPDEKLIVTGSEDGTARVWEAQSGKSVATLHVSDRRVNTVRFTQGGRSIYTEGVPDSKLWTAPDWRLAEDAGDLHFSLDAGTAAEIDGTSLNVHSAADGRVNYRLEGHSASITSFSFSPDNARIVTASDDSTARVWDTATGRSIVVLRGHTKPLTNAVFGPGGKMIATMGEDRTVICWDSSSGKKVAEFQGFTTPVNLLQFSPDGKSVVTSGKGEIKLWRLPATTAISLTPLRDDHEVAAGFSTDGRLLLTTTENASKVWETANGHLIAELIGGGGRFSPDSGLVITDSRIYSRVLYADLDELETQAASSVTRKLSSAEKQKYLHE